MPRRNSNALQRRTTDRRYRKGEPITFWDESGNAHHGTVKSRSAFGIKVTLPDGTHRLVENRTTRI